MQKIAAVALTTGIATIAALAVITTALAVTSGVEPSVAPQNTDSSAPVAEVMPTATASSAPVDLMSSTTANLTYLIEEEKLAHDVYVVLGELWGDRVFSNIQRSESQHEQLVAAQLAAYDIADPRLAAVGEFADPDLQALYDSLIAQGSKSQQDAIAVGVLIEQTDIADLQTFLEGESDPAVLATLDRLLSGSENHLAAFSRQITA